MAAVLFVVGILGVFVIIPAEKSEGEDYGLSPAAFPTVGAVLLTGCAGLKFALSVLRPANSDDIEPMRWRHWSHIAMLAAALVVSLELIRQFGFLVGGPINVAAFMLYMGYLNPLGVITVSIGAPLAIYLFFWQLLGIPLP